MIRNPCLHCGEPCPPQPHQGRPRKYCCETCRHAYLRAKRGAIPNDGRSLLTCASCGSRIRKGPSSLPQGQATCLKCRRGSVEYQARVISLAERRATPLIAVTCPACGEEFQQTRRRQRYCSGRCRQVRQRTNWGNTPAKPKYKTAKHRRERARWLVTMDRQGFLVCAQPVCVMASRTIQQGEPWHLGHDESGSDYIGPTHATCNVKDGARRGSERSRGRARRWAV